MKQHITEQDFKNASEKIRTAIYRKWNDPFLSIGQMIEFLYEKSSLHNFHTIEGCYALKGAKGWHVVLKGKDCYTIVEKELADGLWRAVKETLDA